MTNAWDCMLRRARKRGYRAGWKGASKGPPFLIVPLTVDLIKAWWDGYEAGFPEARLQRRPRSQAA